MKFSITFDVDEETGKYTGVIIWANGADAADALVLAVEVVRVCLDQSEGMGFDRKAAERAIIAGIEKMEAVGKE